MQVMCLTGTDLVLEVIEMKEEGVSHPNQWKATPISIYFLPKS